MSMTTAPRRPSMMIAAIALAALMASAGSASAVSSKVRSACANDYSRFCPSYSPGTAKARQCMRQVGKRLSRRCVDALVRAGYIKRKRRRR